jgi:gamma-glutamylcyclotransferase (GGCT)/AIG2-like uncharacterized protein YtfP
MIPGRDEAAECDQLFVYGTLRRGFRLHYHLIRLGAIFQADAKVAGELFDLGNYPGARPLKDGGMWVQGELFQLRKPVPDLKTLDQVEEFIPRNPERSEFIRVMTDVILAGGRCEKAWIYWLSERVAASRRIGSGDYSGGRQHDGAE